MTANEKMIRILKTEECAALAQQVEHFLGKEEVGSSSLLGSSKVKM